MLTALVGLISGLAGAIIGAYATYWFTKKRDADQRKYEYMEKQIQDFYSPLLGIRKEILARSQIREKIRNASRDAWRKLIENAQNRDDDEYVQKVEKEKWPKYEKLIEFDNKRLIKILLPCYRRMIKLFQENMWLAEEETLKFYPDLLEFVEIWDHFIEGAWPFEIDEKFEHDEGKLNPFYEHLQEKHDELKRKLTSGCP